MSKVLLPQCYRVASHTDNVGTNSIFVAIKGQKNDGVNYIKKALFKGAKKIVIQKDVKLPNKLINLINKFGCKLVKVDNTRKALSALSAQEYKYPASSLKIIGVTGTKGKTTTAWLIEHILFSAGYKTALLSSVKNKIIDIEFESNLTTPQPDYLHAFFHTCKLNKVEYVIMEVAAQAASLHRIDNVEFESIIFTNFSLEHSEFYSSLNKYFNAKVSILKKLKPEGIIFLNGDDRRVINLRYNYKNYVVFGNNNIDLQDSFKIRSEITQYTLSGLKMEIFASQNIYKIESPLIGFHNACNILAAVSFADFLKVDIKTVQKAISSFKLVPGRMIKYKLSNDSVSIIDHAHNPESFEYILSFLRNFTPHLIVVFGCGGDRDHKKRPLMGKIAAKYSDIIILTTDNPRSENPSVIIENIKKGIKQGSLHKIYTEYDREIAIRLAYKFSSSNSIIALLGKGMEEYQLIGSKRIPFKETDILATL